MTRGAFTHACKATRTHWCPNRKSPARFRIPGGHIHAVPSGGVECCFEENPTQRANRVPLARRCRRVSRQGSGDVTSRPGSSHCPSPLATTESIGFGASHGRGTRSVASPPRTHEFGSENRCRPTEHTGPNTCPSEDPTPICWGHKKRNPTFCVSFANLR